MAAPVRIDSNLDTILYYSLKKLVNDGVCTATSGFVGQNPESNLVPPSTNYYVVTGRKQALLNAEARTWQGEVTVRCWAFSALDIAMRDFDNLTQRNGAGVQEMVNKVLAALDIWDMNNGAFYFLAQPMRYVRQDDGHRETGRDSQSPEWSYCDIVFELVYGEDPTYASPNVNDIDEFTQSFTAEFS